MDRGSYLKREALGALVYPIFFLLVLAAVINLGLTRAEVSREVLVDVLVVSTLASLGALGLSAFLVLYSRSRRNRR